MARKREGSCWMCDGEGRGRGLGGEEGQLWEWEINNAINNLGRSHLSSRRRQLVREMNGLSLSSLCPWLRALKLAPPHSRTNRKKNKKEGFLSFFNVFATPSPTAAATNTQTHTPASQTLFESAHPLKQKRHGEASRGSRWCAWECRSTHTHTHALKPAHPLLTHLSISAPVPLPLHSPSRTPGVSLGFHPRSILFSFDTIFTHSSIGSGAASCKYCGGNEVCEGVRALWLFVLLVPCGWNRSTASSFVHFVHQIANNSLARRDSFKHIVKLVQMLSLFVYLICFIHSNKGGISFGN